MDGRDAFERSGSSTADPAKCCGVTVSQAWRVRCAAAAATLCSHRYARMLASSQQRVPPAESERMPFAAATGLESHCGHTRFFQTRLAQRDEGQVQLTEMHVCPPGCHPPNLTHLQIKSTSPARHNRSAAAGRRGCPTLTGVSMRGKIFCCSVLGQLLERLSCKKETAALLVSAADGSLLVRGRWTDVPTGGSQRSMCLCSCAARNEVAVTSLTGVLAVQRTPSPCLSSSRRLVDSGGPVN